MSNEVSPLREFLENVPPMQRKKLSNVAKFFQWNGDRKMLEVKLPDLALHCDTVGSCQRIQMFKSLDDIAEVADGGSLESFITYRCRNCGRTFKTYALRIVSDQGLDSADFFKFGECPQFGPPNPPRLIALFREDKETFLRGRRAENQGMGIGAFAYYRRVIELQKNRLLDKVLTVSRTYNAPAELLVELEAAKKEKRFITAVEAIKQALPDVLFISGQNPLTLLHDALSEGLHAETDEECLEIATDIRVLMAAFAERLAEAVREEAELKQSVARLIQKKANRLLPKQRKEVANERQPAKADGE